MYVWEGVESLDGCGALSVVGFCPASVLVVFVGKLLQWWSLLSEGMMRKENFGRAESRVD